MDIWQVILGAIDLTAVAGLVVALFTLRETKRKAGAEAGKAEAQAKGIEVANFESLLGLLNKQIESYQRTLDARDAKLAEKDAEVAKYMTRLQALYDDMCVHKGCKLRKPHQGQGGVWYEAHKGEESLGGDYLSVETLLRQWRAKAKEDDGDGDDKQ